MPSSFTSPQKKAPCSQPSFGVRKSCVKLRSRRSSAHQIGIRLISGKERKTWRICSPLCADPWVLSVTEATTKKSLMDLAAVLVVCLLAADASDASPTYTVVAPDVVRPNTDFRVAISAHDIEADQESFYNQRQ